MLRPAILIILFLLCAFHFPLFPQSFTWQADTTLKYGTPGNIILFRTYLVNTTASQESLRIFRTNYNFPAGWSSSFCVGGTSGVCHFPFIDTIPDPVILNASGTMELAINVQTSATPDQCDFTVRIENWSYPADFLMKSFSASTYPNLIEDHNKPLFSHFYLYANYPNPFNPETIIRYDIDHGSPQLVKLMIYNNDGQLVRVLVNNIHPTGSYRVIWNGINAEGRASPAGIYYYRLTVGNQQITRKMILIK